MFTFWGFFWAKYVFTELKKYRGVIFHGIEDAKYEEKLTCRFKIDMRNLMDFDPSTRKSKKFVI